MSQAIDGGWRLAARLRGGRSRPWPLRLEPGQAHNFLGAALEPGMDDWIAEVGGTGDAGLDAFNLLTRLYSLFGLGPSEIPYVTDGRVDPDAIRAI